VSAGVHGVSPAASSCPQPFIEVRCRSLACLSAWLSTSEANCTEMSHCSDLMLERNCLGRALARRSPAAHSERTDRQADLQESVQRVCLAVNWARTLPRVQLNLQHCSMRGFLEFMGLQTVAPRPRPGGKLATAGPAHPPAAADHVVDE